MDTNLDKVLRIEDAYEGGISNNPADPGGLTNRGVTQRVYDGFRQSLGQEKRSVRQLTESEHRAIFVRQYWQPINGARLPAGVDLVVMDGAINSGVYQSGKWLQRALGSYYKGQIDGHIGEGTLDALAQHPDHDVVIADYLARRLGMLQNLKTFPTFGKGWTARIVNVKQIGQAWATGSVGPNPVAAHQLGGAAKAYASDVAQPQLSEQTGTQTGVGSMTTGGMLEAARQQLLPLVGTSDFVNKVFVGLTITMLVIGAGGAAYAFYASRKNRVAQRAIDGDVVADVPDAVPS